MGRRGPRKQQGLLNMARKRKQNIARTESGRPSRAKAAQQENLEPIQTRMRMFGLTEKDARDQKAATFIGRLCLLGERRGGISQIQYDAALEYQRVYEAYQRAVKSPDALRSSGGGGDQGESPEYDHWCRSAIARHKAATAAIQIEQNMHENRGANIHAALDYLVLRNADLWHMTGDMRLGLNALAHHFGLMGKRKRQPLAA